MLEIPGYLIEKRLGQGNVGLVYQARQAPLNRPVALRVLHRSLTTPVRDTLLADARAMTGCFHPHLAVVHEVGETGEHGYCCMELLTGGSLRQRLHRRVDPLWAVEVIRALASALGYLHSRDLVHRDLRPRNILFRGDGTPALCDVSSLSLPPGGAHRYLSPEQRAGQSLDRRSDLYALGLVLHEMLSGQAPDGAVPATPPLPAPLASLTPVLARLLAPRPEARHDCAEAFIRDLDLHIDREPVTVPITPAARRLPVPVEATPRPPARRRPPGWVLPSAAVAAGLLGAMGLSLHLLLGQYPGLTLDWFAAEPTGPALQGVPGIPLAATRPLPGSPLLDRTPATPGTPGTAITGRPPADGSGWSVDMVSSTDAAPDSRLGMSFQPRLAAASVSVEPGASATLSDDREPLLSRLLATAQTQYQNLKLTTPRGDNAFETYQSVLRVDPRNADARAGLEAITRRYMAWAQRAWRQGSYRDSLDRIERGLSVDPDHSGLLALRKRVRGRWQQVLEQPLDGDMVATPQRVRIPGGPFGQSAETPQAPGTVSTPRPDLWNRTSR